MNRWSTSFLESPLTQWALDLRDPEIWSYLKIWSTISSARQITFRDLCETRLFVLGHSWDQNFTKIWYSWTIFLGTTSRGFELWTFLQGEIQMIKCDDDDLWSLKQHHCYCSPQNLHPADFALFHHSRENLESIGLLHRRWAKKWRCRADRSINKYTYS